MTDNGPFSGIEIQADETLPPDYIKFLHADDQASVFKLDTQSETSELVATWEEKPVPKRKRRLK